MARSGSTVWCVGFALIAPAARGAEPARPLESNRDIRPILAENCFACHGPDKATRQAGLRLDIRAGAIEHGAITPAQVEQSELIARIGSDAADDVMPRRRAGRPRPRPPRHDAPPVRDRPPPAVVEVPGARRPPHRRRSRARPAAEPGLTTLQTSLGQRPKVDTMESLNRLTFVWWNLNNFAHYEAGKSVLRRRPQQLSHYEAKRDRIVATLRSLPDHGCPDIFAACEITREAAQDLVTKLPSDFDVAFTPTLSHEAEYQVVVIYRKGMNLIPEMALLPSETAAVTSETRPMIPIHLTVAGHVIRFIACHWTGFQADSSQIARMRVADYLRDDVHAFLYPEVPAPGIKRHVVVLGDLNEEPTAELFRHHLVTSRDRQTSHISHPRDKQVRRARLYNLSWRHLGEQIPHGVARPQAIGPAGTWYNDDHGWKTIDHVIASGGLFGEKPPYLDEENTRIISNSSLVDERGRPEPFAPESLRGVSDHLPIVGQLVLPGDPK